MRVAVTSRCANQHVLLSVIPQAGDHGSQCFTRGQGSGKPCTVLGGPVAGFVPTWFRMWVDLVLGFRSDLVQGVVDLVLGFCSNLVQGVGGSGLAFGWTRSEMGDNRVWAGCTWLRVWIDLSIISPDTEPLDRAPGRVRAQNPPARTPGPRTPENLATCIA
eukprot:349787-Chlamydomonas_euryale.AAC.2